MHKTVQLKKYTATWYSHAVRNAVKIKIKMKSFYLNKKKALQCARDSNKIHNVNI